MAFPVQNLAYDTKRITRSILRRIAGEFLVGQVGIVLERPGRLDNMDATAPLTLSEFRAMVEKVACRVLSSSIFPLLIAARYLALIVAEAGSPDVAGISSRSAT